MLIRADAIELAILKFLIEWHDDAGWQGYRGDIEATVRRSVNDASSREVIESLILLHSGRLVGIWRYVSGTWVPYDPEEGSTYFYNGDFRCKPLPGSSRRQQELSRQNRRSVFVSHFGPESPIAVHLKQFMLASFAPPIPVFVSSDYDSIPSGQWYPAILAGLKQSEVIICLLSPVSIDRRWLNFEGGFGFGSEAEVIPLVWGQLTKEQIGMPLGQLQARALNDCGDIKAMMKVIAERCHLLFDETGLEAFMGALPAIEAKVPTSELSVTLFRDQNRIVNVSIQNVGTRNLNMVEVELMLPTSLNRGSNWNFLQAWEPLKQLRQFEANGVKYIGNALTTLPTSQAHLGINPLRTILTPTMGEHVIAGISLPLPSDLTADESEMFICYSAQSQQVTVGPVFMPISQIPIRER